MSRGASKNIQINTLIRSNVRQIYSSLPKDLIPFQKLKIHMAKFPTKNIPPRRIEDLLPPLMRIATKALTASKSQTTRLKTFGEYLFLSICETPTMYELKPKKPIRM